MTTQSVLTKSQVKIQTVSGFRIDGGAGTLKIKIRYDDECGNGHNTFAITADLYRDSREWSSGCLHNDIEKWAPELVHLIKWHSVTSKGPLHYIANTTFHARSVDTEGKKVGDPVKFEKVLKFENIPFTFKQQEQGFFKFLEENRDSFKTMEINEIPYDGKESYDFEPNYTIGGFLSEGVSGKWYQCPFKTKNKAEEFLTALQTNNFEFIEIPVKWCKAVTPNLQAARSTAIWPNATLEQLQSKEQLNDRLPSLMKEFKDVIESLGFVF